MNSETVRIFDSVELLAEGFAEFFVEEVRTLLKEKKFITVALSGGNTPLKIFEALAGKFINSVEWNRIHFYWVDERCVPINSGESNYGNAWRVLFEKTGISSEQLHPIYGETDPEDEIHRYEDAILKYVQLKDGIPCFDMILLGLGEDGHTASIFPDRLDLFATQDITAHTKHPETGQNRITITGNVINNAARIYFIVSGDKKSAIVKSIIEETPESELLPAAKVHPKEGTVTWFLDSEAGKYL
ncbi:MAG: 6-phosphogluconolactonase [Ignavibacteria bacterium]|nr:6-phosphogluconolactonase [Ignavibacteria bacterium]